MLDAARAPRTCLLRALRSRVGRFVVTVWLVGQTASGALAPVADALTGHGSDVVAHVEDDAGTHCPPAHSEVGCHLAAAAATPSVVDASAVQGEQWWRLDLSRPGTWDAAPPVGAARALPLGRGPPPA